MTVLSSLISFVYSLVRHHNGPGECQPFIIICLMSPKWIFNQFTAVGKGDHEWLLTIYMLPNPISVSESVENHACERFLYEVKIPKMFHLFNSTVHFSQAVKRSSMLR